MPAKLKESILITRLKKAMMQVKVNASDLAVMAGVGSTFVYDILKGKSKNPTTKKLASVAKALNVSVSWLYGEENQHTPLNENLILLPTLGLRDDCGFAEENFTIPHYFHKDWLEKNFDIKMSKMAIAKVAYSDMSPTLEEGDVVLLDVSVKEFKGSAIYAVIDDGCVDIKRVRQEKNKLVISGDNIDVSDIVISKAAINIAGKVLWFSRFC